MAEDGTAADAGDEDGCGDGVGDELEGVPLVGDEAVGVGLTTGGGPNDGGVGLTESIITVVPATSRTK
jgi:hypothetical protein